MPKTSLEVSARCHLCFRLALIGSPICFTPRSFIYTYPSSRPCPQPTCNLVIATRDTLSNVFGAWRPLDSQPGLPPILQLFFDVYILFHLLVCTLGFVCHRSKGNPQSHEPWHRPCPSLQHSLSCRSVELYDRPHGQLYPTWSHTIQKNRPVASSSSYS
ncbi:hypothetical protein RSAG8_07042, partial [Rhizoctonia solani AG-8 WAC10335]